MTYRTSHNSLKFLNYIKFKNRSGTFLTPCNTVQQIISQYTGVLLQLCTGFFKNKERVFVKYIKKQVFKNKEQVLFVVSNKYCFKYCEAAI